MLEGGHVKREERGAAAVEFAIVITVFFMVLFGIIQFGIAYNRAQGLQAGAREGARLASVAADVGSVTTRVRAAQSLFTEADVSVKIESSTNNGSSWSVVCTACSTASTTKACGAVGTLVRVTATVAASPSYAIVIPLWGNVEITFTADGQFRCEQ